jgi:glutathione S-transferase
MIRIYDAPKSGHAHRVRLAASVMGIPFELVPVAQMEGDRKGAAYLAINPLGEIPAIVDGTTVVRDSIAILIYLAETYAADRDWLPRDRLLRTQVHEWFAVAAGHIYRGPWLARVIKLFGRPGNYDAAVAASTVLFKTMERHLEGRRWLVGTRATLADIACYSYIAVANEGGLDLAPYPNIRAWLASVEGLDGFLPMPRSA